MQGAFQGQGEGEAIHGGPSLSRKPFPGQHSAANFSYNHLAGNISVLASVVLHKEVHVAPPYPSNRLSPACPFLVQNIVLYDITKVYNDIFLKCD